jgi:hypothetical protein
VLRACAVNFSVGSVGIGRWVFSKAKMVVNPLFAFYAFIVASNFRKGEKFANPRWAITNLFGAVGGVGLGSGICGRVGYAGARWGKNFRSQDILK